MSRIVYAELPGTTSDDGFSSGEESRSRADSVNAPRSKRRAKSPMSIIVANTIGQTDRVKLGKVTVKFGIFGYVWETGWKMQYCHWPYVWTILSIKNLAPSNPFHIRVGRPDNP